MDGWDKLFQLMELLREDPDEKVIITVLTEERELAMTLGELRQVFREGWPE